MLGLWRDVVFGFRGLARKPGFTAAALATLMLGIGTSTAVFTVFDAVYLRPLHLEELDRLVAVFRTIRNDAGEYLGEGNFSYPNYLDYRARNRSFEDLALYQWIPVHLTGGSEPERVTGSFVTASFFDLLGLEASQGRLFGPQDGKEMSDPVAVLAHGAWLRLFGGDPGAVGATVEVNGEVMTIVGVAPPGFRGAVAGVAAEVFLPVHAFERLSPWGAYFDDRAVGLFSCVGKLREGISVAQASEEVLALARQLAAEYPETLDELGGKALPLAESAISPAVRGQYKSYAGRLLLAAAILPIACLSVANLLFVRGVERARELAVRQALGAGRGRLLRQLATENALLFALGGVASLAGAHFVLRILWSYRPPGVAGASLDLAPDVTMLGLTFVTTLAVGLLFGLWPALRAARTDLVTSLKDTDAQGAKAGLPAILKPRSLVVVLQVALAVVALVGCGLLVRSLQKVLAIDLGFASDRLAVLTVSPGEQGYDQELTRSYYRRLLERARELPGVEAAALSQNRLLRGSTTQRQIYLPGDDAGRQIGARNYHRVNVVAPGFFDTVGIRLLQGRDFRDEEEEEPRLAIVNETMAETLWPGREPIGQRFHFDFADTPPYEVVGVAADAKYRAIREPDQFFVYLPLAQNHATAMTLHVRVAGDPAAILPRLRREVQDLDPRLALADVETMGHYVAEAQWMERASTSLLGLFGALALALAVVGLYGLSACSVELRRQELGIRIALGARRRDVLKSVLGEAFLVVAVGAAIGVVAAVFALKPILAGELEDVSLLDPATYGAWILVLLAAALAGAFPSAWRATRANPSESLRAE